MDILSTFNLPNGCVTYLKLPQEFIVHLNLTQEYIIYILTYLMDMLSTLKNKNILSTQTASGLYYLHLNVYQTWRMKDEYEWLN